MRFGIVLIALAACSKDGGGASTGSGSAGSAAAGGAASASAKKGGGFSASLQAELAKEGSGSAAGSAAPAAGSATVAAAGSAAAPAAGSAAVPAAGSASAPAMGSAAKGSAAVVAETKPDTKPPVVAVERPSATRAPVAPSAEQAAIKLDLEPNWDRDVGEAGTISFVLKVPNTQDTRLFSFRYGYDPATAPADRDAYMKWLGDQKILNVTLNRQRGAAWYLEGTDGNGSPAFRYLVNYGGKHLICYGSLYKDAASSQLGDLRDKVVMAAKKICETMTL